MDAETRNNLAERLIQGGSWQPLLDLIAERKTLEMEKLGKATRNIFEDIPRYYCADGAVKALQALMDDINALIQKGLENAGR